MQIQSLSVTNFRSFKRLELAFSDHITLLHGNNAQGKTTILEAVHFLSILTSPISGYDRELVNLSCLNDNPPVGRLIAVIEKSGKTHRIEVRLILTPAVNGNNRLRKEVLMDGVKRRLFDCVGFFNSVLFLPQMTRIIEDGPDERRKYLDQTLSQAYPGYMKSLSIYQQAILKRNALLKQLSEKGGDENQLIYWDQLISEYGAVLIKTREEAVFELHKIAISKHAALTKGGELLGLDYQPSFNPWEIENTQYSLMKSEKPNLAIETIQTRFQKSLSDLRREEIRRGVTTIGPHRDELLFKVNGVNLGVYGSRGQIRSAVMSLKFAEIDWLKEKTGELPVLLLDETLAELDLGRRRDLLGMLENGNQSILTTADLELFPQDFISKCKNISIGNGVVT